MAKCRHPKRYVVDLDECVRCRCCGEHLSLGPSNDDIPSGETIAAVMADGDDYWIGFDDPDGYDWDVSRPLAEQWPWGPADLEHMALGDAMLEELIDNPLGLDPESVRLAHEDLAAANTFAAVDTASREPWLADAETQMSVADETRLRAAADEFLDGIGTVVPEGAA